MKKVLTILLCAVLALSFVGVADAAGEQTITGADYSSTPAKSVTVSLSIDESFTVTIPSNFHLTNSGDGVYKHYDAVHVFISRIDANNYLTVSIDGGDYSNETGWYLKNGAVKLLFGIKLGPDDEYNHIGDETDSGLLKEESPIISTNECGRDISTGMHFKLLDNLPTQSGQYEAIITFKVSMETEQKGHIYLNPQQTST